jgi:hypothetical protein
VVRKLWIDRDTTSWKIQGELRRFKRRPFQRNQAGKYNTHANLYIESPMKTSHFGIPGSRAGCAVVARIDRMATDDR